VFYSFIILEESFQVQYYFVLFAAISEDPIKGEADRRVLTAWFYICWK